MQDRALNGVPVADILTPLECNPELVERIAERRVKGPALVIEEANSQWPAHFRTFERRILDAFHQPHDKDGASQEHANGAPSGDTVRILSINHVGSTSVPGLPAKAVIDIDLVLTCNSLSAEQIYVPRLEHAGFQFLLREPAWHEHRFFCASEPMMCNLHVWGPLCPEVERHRILRDWLREHEDEKELYAKKKRECAVASQARGDGMAQYTSSKDEVIHGILLRAFRELGFLSE